MEDRSNLEDPCPEEVQGSIDELYAELNPIFTIDEVAALLKVSRKTVIRNILSGSLRAFNPDDELQIARTDLVEFLSSW